MKRVITAGRRHLAARNLAVLDLTIATLIAAGIAGSALLATTAPAAAAQPDQVDHGRKVPEVPVAALLPAAGGLAGAGYYLVARFRTRRRGDGETPPDSHR
ncbi:MAG: hypothetical protein WC273_06510 [Dehalococcoidia bacterium]